MEAIDAQQVRVWKRTARHGASDPCLVWGTSDADVACGESALRRVVQARGLDRDVKRLSADAWLNLTSYLLNATTDADRWEVDPKECAVQLKLPEHVERAGGLTMTMLDRRGKTYTFGYTIRRIVIDVDPGTPPRLTATTVCDVGDDL